MHGNNIKIVSISVVMILLTISLIGFIQTDTSADDRNMILQDNQSNADSVNRTNVQLNDATMSASYASGGHVNFSDGISHDVDAAMTIGVSLYVSIFQLERDLPDLATSEDGHV
jgi:hypothetical protein